MRILFGSIVRDGTSYLSRYFNQLKNLTSEHEIGLAICEGDSTDDTYNFILSNCPNELDLHLYQYNHGGQKFGSIDNPTRWGNIARTWNYMLDEIDFYDKYDLFCYMEADLIWDNFTINNLIEGIEIYDCVAPMSMMHNLFYDTWGHRSNGINFHNTYPYHPDYLKFGRYMPLQSAGSCILMKIDVIKQCRLNYKDAMIGHDIVKNGYSFMLDKYTSVFHP